MYLPVNKQHGCDTSWVQLQEKESTLQLSNQKVCRLSGRHLPSGTSLSLICCRQGTVLSSLTSVLVWNSSSRSAGCLDGSLGLDSGETQHDTVFPIPEPGIRFTLLQPSPGQRKYLQLAKVNFPQSHTHYRAIVGISTTLSLRAKPPLSTNSQESHSCPFVGMQVSVTEEELARQAQPAPSYVILDVFF